MNAIFFHERVLKDDRIESGSLWELALRGFFLSDKSNFLSFFFFLDLTRIFLFKINSEFNTKYFCSLFFFYIISSSMQTDSISLFLLMIFIYSFNLWTRYRRSIFFFLKILGKFCIRKIRKIENDSSSALSTLNAIVFRLE